MTDLFARIGSLGRSVIGSSPPPDMVFYHSKARSIGSSGNWSISGYIRHRLANPSLPGNTIVIWVSVSGNWGIANFSVVDDQSNTYTRGTDTYNSTGDIELMSFYCVGATAGAHLVRVLNSTANNLLIPQIMSGEYNGITGLDVSSGNTGSSATFTAGSLAVTQANDLIVAAGIRTTSATTTAITAGSQSNITWRLIGENLRDGHAMQYGVYTSATAINPTMSNATTTQFAMAALAFKTASGVGTARPAGLCLIGITGVDCRPGDFTTSYAVQMSAYGNLRVLSHVGGVASNAPTITAVTPTGTEDATWATCGTGALNDSRVGMWYGRNGGAHPDATFTVTLDVSTGDFTFNLYDIQGANVNPLDTGAGYVTATGTQGSAGNLTSLTITPSTASGITIANLGVAFNTVQDPTSPTNALFDQTFVDGFSTTGPVTPDENNGWGHLAYSSTAAQAWTWTQLVGGTAFGQWASSAACFKV